MELPCHAQKMDGPEGFTSRMIDRTEWAVSWEAMRHATRIDQPNRRIRKLTTDAVGDFTLGAKVALRDGGPWALSAAFRARALAPEGTAIVDPATFSPDLILLNSLSFDHFRLHVNTGYRLDNTLEVLEPAADDDPALSRSTRLSRGIVTEDSFIFGAAVDSDLPLGLTAFLEGFMYYDEDGRAVDSRGRVVNLNFGSNPIWVTPGLRAQVTRRVMGEIAADVGLSGDFPGENEVVPPWKLLIGISFLGFAREAAPAAPPIVAPAPAPEPAAEQVEQVPPSPPEGDLPAQEQAGGEGGGRPLPRSRSPRRKS